MEASYDDDTSRTAPGRSVCASPGGFADEQTFAADVARRAQAEAARSERERRERERRGGVERENETESRRIGEERRQQQEGEFVERLRLAYFATQSGATKADWERDRPEIVRRARADATIAAASNPDQAETDRLRLIADYHADRSERARRMGRGRPRRL